MFNVIPFHSYYTNGGGGGVKYRYINVKFCLLVEDN